MKKIAICVISTLLCIVAGALPIIAGEEGGSDDSLSGRAGRGSQTVWGVRPGDKITWSISTTSFIPEKVSTNNKLTWEIKFLGDTSANVLETYIEDGKTISDNKLTMVFIDAKYGMLLANKIYSRAGIYPLEFNGNNITYWVPKSYSNTDYEWEWTNDANHFSVYGEQGMGYSGFEPLQQGWIKANIHKGTGIVTSANYHHEDREVGIETGGTLTSELNFDLSRRPYCIPIWAFASASAIQGFAPLTVTFTSTVTNGTPPYKYSWDFGDGTSSTSANPAHVFSKTGTFTVRLTATDANGVSAQPIVNILVFEPLKVTVGSNVTSGNLPLNVSFTANGQGGTPPYKYQWNFGDGQYSNLPGPSHNYTHANKYTVTLTLTDSKGYYVSEKMTIQAGNPPQKPSTPSTDSGTEPEHPAESSGISYAPALAAAAAASTAAAGISSFAIMRKRRRSAAGKEYMACPDCGGAVWFQPQFHGYYCNSCTKTQTWGPMKRGPIAFYGCPSCSKPVAWVPSTKKWSCGHCDTHPSSGPIVKL